MPTIDDYVARVEGTCDEEKDIIVVFKYDKKDQAIANIMKKTKVKRTITGIIFELTFENISFRLYKSGKAIFRSVKNREELNRILIALLL